MTTSDPSPKATWRFRVVVLLGGHALMMVLLGALGTLDPPNTFKFGGLGQTALFALLTSPAIVVGLLTVSRVGSTVAAALQALSPLALVSTMFDSNTDLSFIILLWWIPVPMAVAVVVVLDWLVRSQRTHRQMRAR